MLNQDFATWQCGNRELALARPRIMGVLNVTPDSFSDGGRYKDVDDAVAHGLALLDAGADIIDVGGESTRPGFTAVSPDDEAKRVVPVVRALLDEGALVSIDTRHAAVARMCVRLGVQILNDVTGFTDPDMVQVAADTQCGCVVVHAGEVSDHPARRSVLLDSDPRSREQAKEVEVADKTGDPAQERLDAVMARSNRATTSPTVRLAGARRFPTPESAPIMRRVMGFLGDRARTLMRAGVAHDRICLDPGPGFGKLADEDVVIQRATKQLVSMGYPVMCAVSRKRFVGALSGVTDASERDAATIGVCLAAAEAGARVLRVHDVASVAQAVDSYWAIAHPTQKRAFVALGSNVGDRLDHLRRAVALISEIPLTAVTGVSHAYESDPAYGIATPVANAVVEVRTELTPEVLLGQLLAIEDALGRERPEGQDGHGPRTIDCDLVFMEDEWHAGERLRLPHPGLAERDFVLFPMEDLVHDPARYLRHAGIAVVDREHRVGIVREDLGVIDWE